MADWKDAILKVAPALGAVLGGPVGLAIGGAAMIGKALLGKDDATEDEIATAVQQGLTPEQIVRLKELENDLQKAVLAAKTRESELEVQDREGARARDTAITTAGGHNLRGDLLAFLAVGGLVICVYFVASDVNLPERAVNAIMFVAGVLASAVRDVYGFEFGSSRGSAAKDETINQLAKK